MAEYIRKESAISIFRAKAEMAVCTPAQPYFDCAAKMLELLPAADVAPVRHGRWIERKSLHAEGGIIAKCSVCQKDVQYLGNPLKYCPNCGAKMDGRFDNG